MGQFSTFKLQTLKNKFISLYSLALNSIALNTFAFLFLVSIERVSLSQPVTSYTTSVQTKLLKHEFCFIISIVVEIKCLSMHKNTAWNLFSMKSINTLKTGLLCYIQCQWIKILSVLNQHFTDWAWKLSVMKTECWLKMNINFKSWIWR